jgi:hypothetical protein
MPARDAFYWTQGSEHDPIPTLYHDVADSSDEGTTVSHHLHFDVPTSTRSFTTHGLTSPQRRRVKTTQPASRSNDSFPPPRGSSLTGHSPRLDPHASSLIARDTDNPSCILPGGSSTDPVDSHSRRKDANNKGHSKCGGCKAVSKAMRNLGGCLRSSSCTSAPGLSGSH